MLLNDGVGYFSVHILTVSCIEARGNTLLAGKLHCAALLSVCNRTARNMQFVSPLQIISTDLLVGIIFQVQETRC
jgi:hypothetical protein